jgi:hypothetical protein
MIGAGVFPKSVGDKIFAADIEKLRRVPPLTTGTYVLSHNQTGGMAIVTGTVTVPNTLNQFQDGDVITVHNNSAGSVSIVTQPGVICQIAGTTITPTVIARNGLVTFLCISVSTSKFLVIGSGVS